MCGCQKYDNVDGSRRGVLNSFFFIYSLHCQAEIKSRVFKISRLSCSLNEFTVEPRLVRKAFKN